MNKSMVSPRYAWSRHEQMLAMKQHYNDFILVVSLEVRSSALHAMNVTSAQIKTPSSTNSACHLPVLFPCICAFVPYTSWTEHNTSLFPWCAYRIKNITLCFMKSLSMLWTLNYIIILCTHRPPKREPSFKFSDKHCTRFLLIPAKCSAHLIPLYLVTVIFHEERRLWISSLCSFISFPDTQFLSGQSILLSSLNLYASIKVWEQVLVQSVAEAKGFSSSLCVQTRSEAHPASCPMGTGGPFPGGKMRPRRDADHSPNLEPRSRTIRSSTSFLP
jgi:hypothetical protein